LGILPARPITVTRRKPLWESGQSPIPPAPLTAWLIEVFFETAGIPVRIAESGGSCRPVSTAHGSHTAHFIRRFPSRLAMSFSASRELLAAGGVAVVIATAASSRGLEKSKLLSTWDWTWPELPSRAALGLSSNAGEALGEFFMGRGWPDRAFCRAHPVSSSIPLLGRRARPPPQRNLT